MSVSDRPERVTRWSAPWYLRLLDGFSSIWFGVTMLVLIFIYSSVGSALPPVRQGALADWVGTKIPMAHLVIRVSQHNSMHTGQNIDLRRALGMKSIFS